MWSEWCGISSYQKIKRFLPMVHLSKLSLQHFLWGFRIIINTRQQTVHSQNEWMLLNSAGGRAHTDFWSYNSHHGNQMSSIMAAVVVYYCVKGGISCMGRAAETLNDMATCNPDHLWCGFSDWMCFACRPVIVIMSPSDQIWGLMSIPGSDSWVCNQFMSSILT